MSKPERLKPQPESIKNKELKENIKKAKKLEPTEIDAKGSITAGAWVAEMDSGSIRKTSLRKS